MEDTTARLTARTIHLLGTEVMHLDEDEVRMQTTTIGTKEDRKTTLATIHQLQIEDEDHAHNLLVKLQGTDHVPLTRILLTGVMEFLSSG